jgi:hypothetical protein
MGREREEKESLHATPRFFDNRPQSLICERSYYFSQSALTGNEMLYRKLSNSREIQFFYSLPVHFKTIIMKACIYYVFNS